MAIGFALIWGVLGILNLAHGQTVAFGMFAGLIASTELELPIPISFAFAVATGILIALIVERMCYRPIRRAHELVPMIATLGFWIATEEMLQKVYFHLYFHDFMRFPNPYTMISFEVGEFRIRFDYVITFVVAVLLVVGTVHCHLPHPSRHGAADGGGRPRHRPPDGRQRPQDAALGPSSSPERSGPPPGTCSASSPTWRIPTPARSPP